ncbi:G-type lectin S-receptor-like serine/threonine-protein kinase SD2-5 [Tripterygium wilfordii]|uniref:G-type lectin S-receptor-like serine/threonine-protein kinase SD2-5 n=1 Tax=Tripterygium wilfordii TaxID=458696 RepID=UPI0018F7E95B|nr:G-type lectin S-receptor-like serine/threonine-protein kinase SD2-5 [Tripterygium wilfordii]
MEFGEIICVLGYISLLICLQSETSSASIQSIGMINPGFQGSQMSFIDRDGLFLLSNNSDFAFGFYTTSDVTLFLLVVVHMGSSQKVIWSANRGSPVTNSDNFVFDKQGNVFLQKGGSVVWTTNSGGKGVSAMELRDNGNLVLVESDSNVIWQSFDHPTDTLITNQVLKEGMKLVSDPSSNNLSYVLEIKSGDMTLSAAYQDPQPYWSIRKDNRITVNKDGGVVATATIEGNSWRFYDSSGVLLWQFIFVDTNDANGTWIADLGSDGFISFNNLQDGGENGATPTQIPTDPCDAPESCGAYYICSNDKCQCTSALSASGNCSTGIVSPCDRSNDSTQLVNVEDGLGYFALGFVPPSSKTDLDGCKASCVGNCSCLGLFFQNSSGNCFLLDSIGSFKSSDGGSGFVSYIKVLSDGGSGTIDGSKKSFPIVAIIATGTVLLIAGLLYAAFRYYKWKKRLPESPQETSEEDNFLEGLSGMPIRFSYRDLQTATNNFSMKLGQGGFGSVYEGVLPDGTRLAVKKLEGIGQGKKEFRAEVSIIGSIHHHHLVRLKGFCAEGRHRLLAYEYMANGSLDKWIFKKNQEEFLLDWETRFSIALGTAKGLAYLHEDCDAKIVHCDIKPENVLLDDHFRAKVSDFGLAKLMTREQSHVFTTLRGTRGYLAPEWITNYAISEKSDVYSYGMVLLEIIGGRRNFDPTESSGKSHFPSYAFKMMEEGKLKEIVDIKLKVSADDEESVSRSMKVALWCIQEDMHLRPSMNKVVQMLEAVSPVPLPPMSSPMGSRLFASFSKSTSGEGTASSGPSEWNSDTTLSAVRLSGPR